MPNRYRSKSIRRSRSARRSRSPLQFRSARRSPRPARGGAKTFVVRDNYEDRFRVTTSRGCVTIDMLPIKAGQKEQRIVDDLAFFTLCKAPRSNACIISFNLGESFLYLSDRALLCHVPGPIRFRSIVGNNELNYSWVETNDALYLLTEYPPVRIEKAGFVASGLTDPYEYLYSQKPASVPFKTSTIAQIRGAKVTAKKLKATDV